MILAAGRGERMRPLTDHLPKPLLEAGNKPLIVWHLERLAKAGFERVVINHAWLGEKIEAALGDGSSWGLKLSYSAEQVALETAGGIFQALPQLGQNPFLVISGDIFCEFDFSRAHSMAKIMQAQRRSRIDQAMQAYCVMVPNAPHHPQGDFAVRHGALLRPELQHSSSEQHGQGTAGLTFSGIAVYNPSFFHEIKPGEKMPLRPLLEKGIDAGHIGAEVYSGFWMDIGTPERLQLLDQRLRT